MSLDGYCETLKLAFEHQGEQHYSDNIHFGDSAAEQEQIQAYDKRKQQLCREHGVDLILIREVPRLTPLDKLRDTVIEACKAVGKAPPDLDRPVRYEQAYIEDSRLHRLTEFARAKGGELVEQTYFGMRHRYTWHCSNGHEWHQTADTVVVSGRWCPFCAGRHNITLKLLQQRAREKGGEIISTVYRNRNQKVTCRCSRGHVFQHAVKRVCAGSWCPTCKSDDFMAMIADGLAGRSEITLGAIFEDILGIETPKLTPIEMTHVGQAMRLLGWKRVRVNAGGQRPYVYVRADDDAAFGRSVKRH